MCFESLLYTSLVRYDACIRIFRLGGRDSVDGAMVVLFLAVIDFYMAVFGREYHGSMYAVLLHCFRVFYNLVCWFTCPAATS